MKPGSRKRAFSTRLKRSNAPASHAHRTSFRQKEYWFGHADKTFDGEVSDAAVTVTRRNICTKVSILSQESRKCVTRSPMHVTTTNQTRCLIISTSLKWDGKPRLDKMLHSYLGADDTPLNAAIGRKMMCAIVRRAKQPGCKFDDQLVLQGAQGIRKSTFCEDLAVFPDLFTDAGDLSGTNQGADGNWSRQADHRVSRTCGL